ncbi:MAG TPA: oligosaccharide flippase family protein [Acetobacteraceae bacterium]
MAAEPAGDLLARTARGAGWVMAWRLGMRVLGLASTLVLVRLLAPADFGLVALGTSFMQAIDGMMVLGTDEAVIRDHAPDRHVYDTAFTLNLLRGLAVGSLVAAGAFPAATFFGEPRLGPLLLFVACLPVLDGLANIGAVDFRRDFAFHKEFAIMVLPKLGGIVAAIGAALLLRSYVAMLCGMGVNRGLRMVMSYVMHPYRPRLSLRAWRGLAGYSFWTWLLSLAVLLRDRSDSLLLGRLTNATMVGLYSVGAEIAALPTTELIEPLGRASFSGFAEARRTGVAAGETYLRLIGSAALLVLPAGAGLSLVAAPLVRVALGGGWDAAVPVLQVLAVAGTMMVFGQISLHLMSAHALLGRLVGITLAGGLLRIALLAALIPGFGLTGAAWAVGLSIAAEQALTLAVAFRHFGVSARSLAMHAWRPVGASAAMTLVLWWSGLGWQPAAHGDGAGALATAVMVGAAAYLASLLAAWWVAGRPAGPEADILAVLRRAMPDSQRRPKQAMPWHNDRRG